MNKNEAASDSPPGANWSKMTSLIYVSADPLVLSWRHSDKIRGQFPSGGKRIYCAPTYISLYDYFWTDIASDCNQNLGELD